MLSLSMKSSMLLCLKKLVLIEQCMCQVLLQPSRSELLRRLQERIKIGGHFMPASLLRVSWPHWNLRARTSLPYKVRTAATVCGPQRGSSI